jgi:ribosomal protein L37AE/L43A
MTAHSGAAAGCTTPGNSAYWYCDRCGKYYADEAGETEIEMNSWVIPATGHHMTAHPAAAAGCTTPGNSAYWYCDRCGKYYADEAGETEIEMDSWVIPAAGHHMTEHPAVAAGCTTPGNSAYWYCDRCRKYYSDAEGTTAIEENDWVIGVLGHKMTHHPAAAATCTEAESSEYWSCDRCHKYFADEAGNTEIGENSWITGDEALGHDWGEPEYTWSADNRKCTATRICKRDESHIETENGTVTSQTTPATRTAAGKTVYTATFTNPAFAAQVKEVTIPKLAAPVGSYTDKATGTYEIRADWTAAFKKPAKSKATVTIPDTIKVKGYDIPVTAIADKAFSKDKNLTTVTIGKNVITIGKNAFNSCAKLKTVKGGAAVEAIRDSAFSGCGKLKTLPSFAKLKTIGANAFKGCKALTKITVGTKVNAIGKNAFSGCAKLKTITIKSTLLTKKNVKNGAFKGIDPKATVKCPKKKLEDYRKFLPGKGVPKTATIK